MKRTLTMVLFAGLLASGCTAQPADSRDDADAGPELPSGRSVEETLADRAIVPDVKGLPPDEAESVLEEAGFTVVIEGDGDEVTAQFPAPGTSVEEGIEVELTVTTTQPRGTRDDPFPFGTTLAGTSAGDVEEITVLLGTAQWGADATVAAENQFNDRAPEGSTYVLLPVTITNVGSTDAVVPWLAVDIAYVAPDGRSYDQEFQVIPNNLSDLGDLYEGGSATGNMLFALPTAAQGGVWAVSYGWSDPVFVTAG